MNINFGVIDQRLKHLQDENARTIELINAMEKQLNAAKSQTAKLLAACKTRGIEAVCIGVSNKKVKSSCNFPFGTGGSVFADGTGKDGFPSIWRAVEAAGLRSGCGNSGQMQTDTGFLLDGTYELKNGKWFKID